MFAPDGVLIANVDRKKAMWYVDNNLATLKSEEPLSITLKFEPNGRSNVGEESFYTADRQNICVMCGTTENLCRFHVVPTIYRTHLPDVLKSHRSHDIVLLCFDHHNFCSR